jgi:hypothetical protein
MVLALLPAQAQPPADQPNGVEVLTRGPVHEAFADPGVTPTEAPVIVPKQPPDPINELPPDQKPEGENVQWIPGYFVWDEDRNDFVWLSGIWRAPPPGRTWVPGSWRQVNDGWQWTPGFWASAAQEEVQYLPPPPAPLEAVPSTPAPSADAIFAPGVWVYRNSSYFWRPGVWITYRPGWIWVPAHYVWTPVGWVFVEGYWDYPLRQRGLLFAPVYFTRRLWVQPGWFYRPAYAIYDDFLVGALFLRPRWGGYYFGDYFGGVYERRGFVAWIDFRFGRGVYDPMFGFYLRYHSGRPWDRDLRGLYAARFKGEALPPRTLVQQNTLIQNITVNKTVNNITNVTNITAAAPLTKIDPKIVKLQTVPRDQLVRDQKAAERFREASVQRHRLETQLLTKGSPLVKASDPPRTLKLDMSATKATTTTIKPPPPPNHGPLVTKPLDAKTLNYTGNNNGTTTTPKKDVITLPPMPKKEVTLPPMPKKELPPMPKRENSSTQKKDKDKEKK